MKKILLPPQGENMHHYRANLHCHSMLSDGNKTPQQLRDDYKAHGYSILAITDHNALITHNDLTEKDFLMLNGYEINANGQNKLTCHICLIALKNDNDVDLFYHRTANIPPTYGKGTVDVRGLLKYDEARPDYIRAYSPECINDMMKTARDNGFFVTYNHPTWSMETYEQYINYDYFDAMEIYNNDCAVIYGYDDDNSRCYDDFLRKGKRVFCVATDDNHNHFPDGSAESDSYGGATVIAAEKLDYETVTAALKNGMFYASVGTPAHKCPEIKSISFENDTVFVETSDARKIHCVFYNRGWGARRSKDDEAINSAEFKIFDNTEYFRIVVTDKLGYRAYSRAYFIDEIKKEV